MAKALWRAAVVTHRYLGVVIGLLMLMWFASGIVMMYVGFPEVSAKDRAAVLPALSWQNCCAWPELPQDQAVSALQIEETAGVPVLRLASSFGPPQVFDLVSGTRFEMDAAKANAIAAALAPRLAGSAKPVVTDRIESDQWTVSGEYRRHAPFYHFVYGDAERTSLYLSAVTGQPLLWTRATQRFWNWLGAIPHWLYPTILRSNGALWSQMVIWTSVLGTFLTVIGLVLGLMQIRKTPKSRVSPYRGLFYWHHLCGLIFGIVMLTWVVSGLLSMNPWGLLEGGGSDADERVAGDTPLWREVEGSLMRLPKESGTVGLSLSPFDGHIYWLATHADGSVTRLNAEGAPAPLTEPELKAAAARIARDGAVQSQGLLSEEDSYYFGHHGEVALPVYRLVMNDAARTRYYLNGQTGQLALMVDAPARGYRWLFLGLHRLDFAQWLRARPVWDIVMLMLLAGGLAVTGTGAYLALRRIKRDLSFRRG